ncbi:MAG: tyrosine-protein phosphatase [Desulfocapsaceae bacterium]|nr:tyrosine-protein phosphatase [Desulfocapsaceae bacterium]
MTKISSVNIDERRLPLAGAVNFRDIGGIKSTDSGEVKKGLIYRSDHLSRLTDLDHRLLMERRFKTVCDLRSRGEQERSPDRLPIGGTIQFHSLPVEAKIFDPATALKRLQDGDLSWLSMDFVTQLYRSYLDDFGPIWGRIYTMAVSKDNLPLVFHCTGGKDRTGICAALLLKLLGVGRDKIIAEHLLSNANNAERLKPIYAKFAELGVSSEQAAPYLQAPLEPLIDLFEYLQKKYGTVEDYLLTKGGMEQETLKTLKTTLRQ